MIALPFRQAVDSHAQFPPPGKSTKIHPGVPGIRFLRKHHQVSRAGVQSRPHVHCLKGTAIQRQVDRGKRIGQGYFQGDPTPPQGGASTPSPTPPQPPPLLLRRPGHTPPQGDHKGPLPSSPPPPPLRSRQASLPWS